MKGIPDYHLYASPDHPMGVAFYQKMELDVLGQFEWRLYSGFEWVVVSEKIFVRNI
jgi:hypothetical protein